MRDGLPDLIKEVWKHPHPMGGNSKNVSLIAKAAPIPAPKGKSLMECLAANWANNVTFTLSAHGGLATTLAAPLLSPNMTFNVHPRENRFTVPTSDGAQSNDEVKILPSGSINTLEVLNALPVGIKVLFCVVFIPTYKQWVATQNNPWVAQHLCDWCTSFRSVANNILELFFKSGDNEDIFTNYGDRRECAANMLVDCKFIWATVEKVFATHLNSIIGVVYIPRLRITNTLKDVTPNSPKGPWDMSAYPPKGTLALATAAGVMEPFGERRQGSKPSIKAVSTLNPQTRVVSKAPSKCSAEHWADKTIKYIKSIKKMQDGSLEEIVTLATQYVSPSKIHQQEAASGVVTSSDLDIHACLINN
ncbi:hypothetical protein EI94DRAFT_1708612 [Lactarius quietus]|nr:hypothetical protein EI94DRAFT_1708612 [Lactarius quietus]